MASLVATLLRLEAHDPDVELSVLFCDDPVIQALNRDYRGLDCPTDVLSFAQEAEDGGHRPAGSAEGGGMVLGTGDTTDSRLLGDVVISVETAERQARARGHSLRREVEWLLLHGTLHLLSYDDETEEGLQAMLRRQEAVLAELQLPVVSSQ